MRKRLFAGLILVAAFATTAIAQTTSPGRQQPQQQPPLQVQVPVQQPPAINQRAPLAGQVPVFIQGHFSQQALNAVTRSSGDQTSWRSIHATINNRDYDRDGYAAPQFSGADCDDEDARRNPGQAEVLDREGLDEDCDPATLPAQDLDRDGHVSWQAINVIRASDLRPVAVIRGPDCDDGRADVHPGLPEVLGDQRDNNCDGLIDVVDSPGHREYCPPTDQISAQNVMNPCARASGDTSQFNRR